MKQIQVFFLRSTILLLLAFTSAAGSNTSLVRFTAATIGSEEVILSDSSLDTIDDFTSHSNLDGGDDGINTDGCIFSPRSLASYPLSILAGQTNNRSLHPPIPFYILYQHLIFYHQAA